MIQTFMNWLEENNKLKKEYIFKDFVQAMAWMTECSYHIEKQNHHPEWHNVYNKVNVELCTHDAGNQVTDKDYQLAKILDECFEKFNNKK